MIRKILRILSVMLWADLTLAEANMLSLCHADPMYSEYNYGGIWERDEDSELVCNFWQFLPDGENERPTTIIGSEESEESDFYITPENNDADEVIEYYDYGDSDLSDE